MRVTNVELTDRAYEAYAEYAGTERMTAQRLLEKLRSAAADGEGSVAVWRGERVLFLEGAYWAFHYDRAAGRLTIAGCAALLMAVGFGGRSVRPREDASRCVRNNR